MYDDDNASTAQTGLIAVAIAAGLFVAVGAVVFTMTRQRSVPSTLAGTQPPRANGKMPAGSPAATLEADALYSAYNGNEARADLQYTGKIVHIVTELHKVAKDSEGHYFIGCHYIKPWEPPTVYCYLAPHAVEAASKTELIERLVIRGKVVGRKAGTLDKRPVIVQDCEIVQSPN